MCEHCEAQREAESQESTGGTIQGRRWLAPPVAYPTTQEIKPVDDANDEPRSEPSKSLWQNGFLARLEGGLEGLG